MAICLTVAVPANALPPPPPRPEIPLELTPNGPDTVLRDTVRAYQPVPVTFTLETGDRLMLQLSDATHVLVLDLESPMGLSRLSGILPGPDGLELTSAQRGVYRAWVIMSGEAARQGRSASFELRLRLWR